MGEKKRKDTSKQQFIFGTKNYRWMFIGLALIALGFILMAGGGSNNPDTFSDAIFSSQRIRVAPTLILLGFGIQVYAILLQSKK